MKILLISQYFWPETFIINDLVKCIVEQGHYVEVLTAKPNYPDGKIFEGYSALRCSTELYNNKIPVHRIPIFCRGKGGAKRLILNYFSFVLNGIFFFSRFIKEKKFDVIFVFAPSPITSVIPAIYLKKKFKLPLTVWVQDLWPESLSATGFVKNRFILGFVGSMVRYIYKSADALLVQSLAFMKPMSHYVSEEKIIYYPNSYLEIEDNQVGSILPPKDLISIFEKNKCFVFAGNLGTAQALETLVNAAQQLRHLSDCKLIIVGSGSMSEWIATQIQEKFLDNILMVGRYPASIMPAIFLRATGLLVTLKNNEIFRHTIPSKIQAYLAAGRPIIAALDGEGARVIMEAGAGFACAAEDHVALFQNIERLYNMSQVERDVLGRAGREYFLKYFEMGKQTQRLLGILEDKISKRSDFK